MTSRFILRASPGAVPDGDALAARLEQCRGVQVLDRSMRMLLVAGGSGDLAAALRDSSGWSLIPETITPLPDPRPRLKAKRAAA